MKKEIQKTKEPKQGMEVARFIEQAVANNLPVETMEKLFDLYERAKKDRARTEFVEAMSQFQSKCPIIQKTKKVLNKDGRSVRYTFAPLDSIVEQIQELLADNNLSYTWEVENREGFIKATAVVTHIAGHATESSFEVPVDKEGYMTAPQKYASALTFAKRYSLCNALGISTGDEDTDATDVGKDAEVKSLKSKIVFLLRTLREKTETKEQVEKAVTELTKLPLVEKNYADIVSRLDQLVKEKQEYDNQKINK